MVLLTRARELLVVYWQAWLITLLQAMNATNRWRGRDSAVYEYLSERNVIQVRSDLNDPSERALGREEAYGRMLPHVFMLISVLMLTPLIYSELSLLVGIYSLFCVLSLRAAEQIREELRIEHVPNESDRVGELRERYVDGEFDEDEFESRLERELSKEVA